jgi:hypothetical protein
MGRKGSCETRTGCPYLVIILQNMLLLDTLVWNACNSKCVITNSYTCFLKPRLKRHTRCNPKAPEIGMPHENRFLYICVPLGIASCTLYEPLCQATFCCEDVCVFFCAFLWRRVSTVLRSYRPAKITDVKEQRICIKFCFRLGKTSSETHRMLKEAFGEMS